MHKSRFYTFARFLGGVLLVCLILFSQVVLPVAADAKVLSVHPFSDGEPLRETAPVLNSISPSSVEMNEPEFTLLVTGTNFMPGAVIVWGGASQVTTYLSATTLTAVISANKLTASGEIPITVVNPGDFTSNAKTFTIRPISQWNSMYSTAYVMTSYIFHPSDSSIVYSSSFGGGVYKSTNRGQNWNLVNTGLGSGSSLKVNGLAIDPTAPNTIYAATYGAGIFKTTDGAASWSALNSGAAAKAAAVKIDPLTPSTLYVATGDLGVFKSIDSGGSFAAANNGLTSLIGRCLEIDSQSPSTVYVGTNGGLFKSTDGAGSWNNVLSGIIFMIDAAPNDSQVIFAATDSGVKKSMDGGANWTTAMSLPSGKTSIDAVLIDPVDPRTVYAAVIGGVYKSTDQGVSWHQLNNTSMTNKLFYALVTDPQKHEDLFGATQNYGGSGGNLFYYGAGNPVPVLSTISPTSAVAGSSQITLTVTGTDFYPDAVVIWGSQNLATTFVSSSQLTAIVPAANLAASGLISVTVKNPSPTSGSSNGKNFRIYPTPNQWVSNNLNSTSVTALALPASLSGTIYAGANNATLLKTTNEGTSWSGLVTISYYRAILFHPTTPETVIVATDNGIYQSVNSGTNWSYVGLNGYLVWDLVFDPTNPAIMYAATYNGGMMKSTDSGVHWASSNSGLPPTLTSVVIDPSNPATLYAGTYNNGIYKSTNSGESWSVINNGLGNFRVNKLVIDPHAPGVIYAATSTAVYKSMDGGASWLSSSTNLPTSINTILMDPVTPTTLYVGTNGFGFYKSTNGGTSWFAFNTNLGNYTIFCLGINPSQPTMVYAGANPGVYSIYFPNPVPTLTGINPASKEAGSGGFSLTVTGTNFLGNSVVKWNGEPLTTTFVSPTELTAVVPSSLLLASGEISVTVTNPEPGGGTSSALPFDVQTPVPVLTSINPDHKYVGEGSFQLSAIGTKFINGAEIYWGDSPLTTTFVSSTELTAEVSAARLSSVQSVQVKVVNPGAVTSETLTFTVQPYIPVLTELTPNTRKAQDGAFTLTVIGTDFRNGAVIVWDGKSQVTTFVNSTELSAFISADQLVCDGEILVTVVNPGDYTSNALTFTIEGSITPVVTELSPGHVAVGSDAFTLTVTGTDFFDGAVIVWGGATQVTTFVSNTELTAQIGSGYLTSAGQIEVWIINPGDISSNKVWFVVDDVYKVYLPAIIR